MRERTEEARIGNNINNNETNGNKNTITNKNYIPLIENTYRGCGKTCISSHKCIICGSNMHPFCRTKIGEDGYGQIICCAICIELMNK